MANITLPSGQVISEQDPNYAEYQKTYGTTETQPTAPQTDNGVITGADANGDIDIDTLFNDTSKQIQEQQTKLAGITLPQTPTVGTAGIQQAMNAPVEISDTAKKQQEIIAEEQKRQVEAGVAEQEAIKQSYAAQKEETIAAQTQAQATQEAAFASLGIFTETSSQAIQYLQQNMTQNQKALLSITQAMNESLRQAKDARDSNNFNLMNLALESYQQAEKTANDLKQTAIDNAFRLADLQMQQAQFSYSVGVDAANFTVSQIQTGIQIAQDLRNAGVQEQDIKIKTQTAIREQDTYNKQVEADNIDSLSDIIAQNWTDDEEANLKMIQDLAADYGVDVNKLTAAANSKSKALYEEERKPIEALYDKYSEDLIRAGIDRETTTEGEILMALQPILQEKKDTQSQKDLLDIQAKQAQIAQSYASISKTEAETAKIYADKIKETEGAGGLKENALNSAKDLLTKFTEKRGTSVVGFGGKLASAASWLVGGTEAEDFKVQFNNLKSLLSLENVKYLKGQGQVSDAERRLLSEASAKLELSQSEAEFKDALDEIVVALGGTIEESNTAKFDE